MNTLLHGLTPISSNESQQPRNRESFAPVEDSSPTAGIRTADAGLSRYWTVKYEAHGRTHYVHVEACDAWRAGLVVFRRYSAATSTQVVREIDREEYEHLTRMPA